MQYARRILPLLALLLLAGCGEKTASPAATSAPAAAAVPADAKLAKLYEQTCRACHTTGAGGAPISGDRKAWEPRAAQGLPTLLQHTLSGYKGMPPLGSCSDCTQAEFEALIRFMASIEGS